MIGEAVRAGLRRQGFAVDWVRDGIAAEQALLAETYDACLIDLGLPRKAGLDVLRCLRERGSTLPVLVLKLAVGGFLLALLETVSAKLRIFRVPEFLGTAFLLSVMAMLVQLLLSR